MFVRAHDWVDCCSVAIIRASCCWGFSALSVDLVPILLLFSIAYRSSFVTDPSYPFPSFCQWLTIAMELYPPTRFLDDKWIGKRWATYGRLPFFDANDFSLSVEEANVDPDKFLLGGIHLDWLSSFEWRYRGLNVTHSLGPSQLPL